MNMQVAVAAPAAAPTNGFVRLQPCCVCVCLMRLTRASAASTFSAQMLECESAICALIDNKMRLRAFSSPVSADMQMDSL